MQQVFSTLMQMVSAITKMVLMKMVSNLRVFVKVQDVFLNASMHIMEGAVEMRLLRPLAPVLLLAKDFVFRVLQRCTQRTREDSEQPSRPTELP